MRILYLSPRDCWPPKSGARLRDYHFAKALAARSELTYIFFSAQPSESELGANLPGAAVLPVQAPAKYTAAKLIRGLLGRQPLPVQNYTSPEMRAAVSSALAATAFHLVHLDSIHLAGYLPLIQAQAPNAAIVLDWHNIESELMQRYAVNSTSALKRNYARFTAARLSRLEKGMLRDCAGHIVCSDREHSQLRRLNPNARIAVVENGVDTQHFQPVPSASERTRLVFVGQMSYHANADAIIWFAREIWPAIRVQYPHLELTIVGSDPAPAVVALNAQNSIEVTGTVPDVLPYYQNAFASIVPLQTGGGTRLKILEAMAAGAPVISTQLGAEGLNVEDGATFLQVTNEPQSWLKALSLLVNATKRESVIAEARRLACDQYDWENIGNRLAQLYTSWVNTK